MVGGPMAHFFVCDLAMGFGAAVRRESLLDWTE